MEIVESIDHYFQTVYYVKDGTHTVATVYTMKDAEIVKAALEEARKREAAESLGKEKQTWKARQPRSGASWLNAFQPPRPPKL